MGGIDDHLFLVKTVHHVSFDLASAHDAYNKLTFDDNNR